MEDRQQTDTTAAGSSGIASGVPSRPQQGSAMAETEKPEPVHEGEGLGAVAHLGPSGGGGVAIDRDLLCPICMDPMRDAFLTACGHSFCYSCISTHLNNRRNCPCCSHFLTHQQIFPNFALNKLLRKATASQLAANASPSEHLRFALQQGDQMSVKELDALLVLLAEKRRKAEQEEAEMNMDILLDFLHRSRHHKLIELEQLRLDLGGVRGDIAAVERRRQELQRMRHECLLAMRPSAADHITAQQPGGPAAPGEPSLSLNALHTAGAGALHSRFHSRPQPFTTAANLSRRTDAGASEATSSRPDTTSGAAHPSRASPGPAPSDAHLRSGGAPATCLTSDLSLAASVMAKKKRVFSHFEDLQECYLEHKRAEQQREAKRRAAGAGDEGREGPGNGLHDFQNILSTFTRYSRLKVVAELRHGDLFQTSNIVSSIEFDRDDELFATAGVSRRIKIFSYATVMNELADVHCPVVEMPTRSKLSCLSWNQQQKCQVASSDYEGIVAVWDVTTCQAVMEYEEHEKRTWSVDFSRMEPTQLVSGSDDGKVKIWCTNQESSVLNIDMKANICCVKFNPGSAHHVAVGSADHHIHYFDIRNASVPLNVFTGHRKAVSYVKFLSPTELASASTDSTLRVWDVQRNTLARTMRGHVNEKNFVGLEAHGDFLTCGSETNEVFAYYKAMPKPVAVHRFGTLDPLTGEDSDDDTAHFISAVCWKADSLTMLAANSQGTIKVLSLVP